MLDKEKSLTDAPSTHSLFVAQMTMKSTMSFAVLRRISLGKSLKAQNKKKEKNYEKSRKR